MLYYSIFLGQLCDDSYRFFIRKQCIILLIVLFQVIARENKGILGIDYNRSPHVPFTITRRNIHRPTATPDKEEAKDVISRSDDVVSSTTPASGEDAAS